MPRGGNYKLPLSFGATTETPVSIHTLAYAAYEVIHVVSKKLNPNRIDLLFDSTRVKEDGRKEFNLVIKQHANFFKHSSRDDHTAAIEFPPSLSETFILFAILGLKHCEEQLTDEQLAFLHWRDMHAPNYLTKVGPDGLVDGFPVEAIKQVLLLNKRAFFERMIQAIIKSRA
jgi:hypothetical protein